MSAPGTHMSSGAAALHALTDDEIEPFTDLLVEDEELAAEYFGFLETAARLGSAVAERPPAAMRDEVMRLVSITRQLPPLVDQQTGSHAVADMAKAPAPASAPVEPPIAPVISLAGRRRRLTQWLVAAAAVVVIGTGTVLAVTSGGDDAELAGPGVCIGQAADAVTIAAEPSNAGNSAVVYSGTCGAATFTVSDLAPLTAEQGYQLWVIADAGSGAAPEIRSVGMLTTDDAGRYVPVSMQVAPGETLGVTVEPAGGSDQPTTTPIITLAVPA